MKFEKQREIRIRPLSEGIGLGDLRSVSAKMGGSSMLSRAADANVLPDATVTTVARGAQAAYAPHSVATQIRSRPSTQVYVQAWRFLVGVGLDILVGTFTVFVLAWTGLLAWNAGASGEFDPISALITITDFLEKTSPVKLLVVVAALALTWRLARHVLQSQQSEQRA